MLFKGALSDKCLLQLQHYLHNHADLSIFELVGIFTALACSPHYIPPAVWMAQLGLNQGYSSEDEAQELQEAILTIYEHTSKELEEDTYIPGLLMGIRESEWPSDKIKNYYLLWGKGFIQCTDGVWRNQDDPNHVDAYTVYSELVTSIRKLYDNEAQAISDHDFEIIQTHVKRIHNYWVKKRIGTYNA